jgi:hypothetical protein
MSAADLERFAAELDEVRRESESAFAGLAPAQLAWRPEPRAWSIGQVAAHLRTTNELYRPRMEKAIQQARARGRTRSDAYRPTLMGGWLVRSMGAERKMPAPRVFQPPAPGDRDWEAEVARYRETQDWLAELLAAAQGVSLTGSRVASPVSRIIRMNLGDAFALWLAHDRRHLGQVRRLRANAAFPSA